MSKFQIVKGITDNLTETPYVEGKVYFVYDDINSTDLSIYADIDGARRKITPTTFEEEDPKIHILTLQENENEELTTGEDESISDYVNNNELVIVYYDSIPYFYINNDRGLYFGGINGNTLFRYYSTTENKMVWRVNNEYYLTQYDLPTNVSQLNNDTGYITQETDPTVPSWAKETTKPTYTAAEVGALPDTTVIPEDKVFIATYGKTTYADTLEAYNAGKLIFATYNDRSTGKIILPLTRKISSEFQFEGPYVVGRSEKRICDLSSSGWTTTWLQGDTVIRTVDIASGDSLIIRDLDDNSTTKSSSLAFGTETNQYLANNGTWQTVPENTSDLINDSGFQTSTEVNSAIATAIGNINQFNVAIVSTLPTENIDNHTIYFMSNGSSDNNSIYDEWMYINDNWEKIGTTSIDLSGYMQTSHPANGITSTDISNWNSKTSNTGTVTSVGLTNTTDGGLIISGSPVTNSGSITVGHSNVLSSAQTTQAVYPIKIDKNGHISAYGSAVTITDEKVKQTPLNGSNSSKGLLFNSSVGNSETTNTVYTSNKIMWNDYGPELYIYNSDRNKSGSLTYRKLYLGNNSTNYHGSLTTADITTDTSYVLPDKSGTVALTSDIPTVPTKVSDLTNDSGFISSYTETDPVFSASAAAGITNTDINNWNAKVSDTKTWGNIVLGNSRSDTSDNRYVVQFTSTSNTNATTSFAICRPEPFALGIPKWDNYQYLYASTPSANDNSTKVATTEYVNAAIPDVSGYVSKSGDTMTGQLTLDYNSGNDGLRFGSFSKTYADISAQGFNGNTSDYTMRLRFKSGTSSNGVILEGIANPSNGTDAANKDYVDNKIPKVYSSTNTNGYLTMATLPIYDGTVE